ncbi:MAG: type II toxin-antitoxin system VapB family antitoxin [Deltaproteobacteria bacterium]|nr:type II toxin-antitoxin system VapB family antitoxin [Deltaproteobacteria bacterium]
MRTTITLDSRLITVLQHVSGAKSKAKAVLTAIHEYLRRRQIEKIAQLKGKITFDLSADEIRHAQR